MKTFNKEEWTQIRGRGHARFIVRRGLLCWGVPFGFLVTLGPFLYDVVTHSPPPSTWSMVGSFTFLALAFGYGMGETEWRRSERAFNKNAA